MPINIYDDAGRRYTLGDNFYQEAIGSPLVRERRDTFSFPFGDSSVVRLAFAGIYIVYGDLFLRESRTLHFEMLEEPDLVEMHFTLSGHGSLFSHTNGHEYLFKENEHSMHYVPQFVATGEYLPDKPYKFFEIHFTTRFFFELAKDSSPALIEFAQKIENGSSSEFLGENLPISFPMHQCITEIMHCKFTGGLKLLFLQSKCIELLALQAQAYEDAAGKTPNTACRTGYDKDRIHYAKDYLLQHALQPPSLSQLAKLAGINEFKLKQGFKEVFNNTVFGYLSDYKLYQAREELLSGQTSIKDVADTWGYSSVQHFSTAFRKKFGAPPGKIKAA
jgi:AraC-like DNA-binding protein